MVGIGKWRADVNNRFITAVIDFEIRYENGGYKFNITPPKKYSNITYEYFDVTEKGNKIKCRGRCSAFPKLTVRTELEFNGDRMTAKFSAPPVPGFIKVSDCKKIAD